jgi:uncharacterized protein YndB with AHSA1/START domain
MATMSVTADQDAIVSEIHIAAPAEQVFQALVDPGQVLGWWGQAGVYRCTEFNRDLRAGGSWHGAGIGPDGRRFDVAGEYLEIDPPRALVYSWVASWTGAARTTVRWELETTGQGTRVRIRHSGLAAHPEAANRYQGWPRMLGWLRSFIEKGETVEMRKPISA